MTFIARVSQRCEGRQFWCLDISFFRRIAQGVKQNNVVPFIVLFMGLGDMRNLRRDLANQAGSVEILLMTSDESDKINTQDWGWNITVDTAFNYVPSFYFHLEMYCLHSILWPNLASSRVAIAKTCWWHLLDNSNLKGLFCSKGWNVLLVMEWMKTKRLCHVSSFCNYQGRKHLPVF